MKKHHCSLLFLLLICLFSKTVDARNLSSPRAYGMGGAYVSLTDDYSAIFFNPAGLVHTNLLGINVGLTGLVNKDKASLENNSLFSGTSGKAFGFKLGRLALGYNQVNTGARDNDELTIKKDTNYCLAYGRSLLQPLANLGTVSWGATLKYIDLAKEIYELDAEGMSIDENISKGKGLGLDLGLMIKMTNTLNFGLKIDNLVTSYKWENGNQETLPKVITTGLAINFPVIDLTASADLNKIINSSQTTLRAGIEKRLFFGAFALRAGFTKANKEELLYTAGLGLKLGPVNADLGLKLDNSPAKSINTIIGVRIDF